MTIYRPFDIRGVAHTQLTPELYESWGRALGFQVKPRSKFVVGGDTRGSTPQFLDALAEGLCLAGLDVVELGVSPTPMVDFARRRLRAAGCAIVTASHNPADINGLKWTIGSRPPTPDDVALLKEEAQRNGESRTAARPPGSRRTLDVSYDYVGSLQERWLPWRGAPLRVVLDSMHGCLASRARRYLHAVFPHAVIMVIRDKPDASFGGVPADPSRPELLEALSETVDHERADLGLAFDGDGDRIALVDNYGAVLSPEEATWVLLHSFGEELSGRALVYDQKFSDKVPETARRLGALPLVERSGHAFIRTRMIEADALFGAEVNGHYFYDELEGGDDALMTACRTIAHLFETGSTLADLGSRFPRIFITPDLPLSVAPEDHESVLDHVQASWLDYPHTMLDGIRVDFPDGWALVRSSTIDSTMTFRFESTDAGSLHRLVSRFCDAMPRLGDALWARYEEAMGEQCHPAS